MKLEEYIKNKEISSEVLKSIPTHCPVCNHEIEIIKGKGKDTKTEHIICPNDFCEGKVIKKIERGVKALRIDSLGPATVELLHKAGINSIIDLFNPEKYNEKVLISSGVFVKGRALEIILDEVNKVEELKIDQVINALSFQDSGRTISREVGKFLSKVSYDFKGLNKSVIEKLTNDQSDETYMIKKFLKILDKKRVKVNSFEEEVISENHQGTFEMTGSPKPFWEKKAEFTEFAKEKGFTHDKLNKDSKYLLTDSYSSTSSKMAKASKLGIEIITYEDFKNKNI